MAQRAETLPVLAISTSQIHGMRRVSRHILTLLVIKIQMNFVLSTAESWSTIYTRRRKIFEDMLKERVLESVNQIRSER